MTELLITRHFKLFPSEVVETFFQIKQCVERLPEFEVGPTEASGSIEIISCHVLADALAKLFPEVRRQTGLFNAVCQHSWLIFITDQPYYSYLIDPLPCDMLGGPILVVAGGFRAWRGIYEEATLKNVDLTSEKFISDVARVQQALEKILRR